MFESKWVHRPYHFGDTTFTTVPGVMIKHEEKKSICFQAVWYFTFCFARSWRIKKKFGNVAKESDLNDDDEKRLKCTAELISLRF